MEQWNNFTIVQNGQHRSDFVLFLYAAFSNTILFKGVCIMIFYFVIFFYGLNKANYLFLNCMLQSFISSKDPHHPSKCFDRDRNCGAVHLVYTQTQ